MQDPISNVRQALAKRGARIERDRDDGFAAQCPLHDDSRPSLHVSVGDAGQAVFYCHAGCTETTQDRERLIDALGLAWTDLYCDDRGRGDGFWYEGRGTRNQGPGTRSDVKDAKADGLADGERREREVEALLLAVERGEIVVDVQPLVLPPDAPEPDVRVARFAELVFAVRRWAVMPEEAPLSARWVAGYVRLPVMTVNRALQRLDQAGVIERMGRWGRLGTFVYRPGWLSQPEGAETAGAVLPAESDAVEPDDARRVDERDEVGQDATVFVAVADDRRERLEGDDRRGTAVAEAAGRHDVEYRLASGGPRLAILGWDG